MTEKENNVILKSVMKTLFRCRLMDCQHTPNALRKLAAWAAEMDGTPIKELIQKITYSIELITENVSPYGQRFTSYVSPLNTYSITFYSYFTNNFGKPEIEEVSRQDADNLTRILKWFRNIGLCNDKTVEHNEQFWCPENRETLELGRLVDATLIFGFVKEKLENYATIQNMIEMALVNWEAVEITPQNFFQVYEMATPFKSAVVERGVKV